MKKINHLTELPVKVAVNLNSQSIYTNNGHLKINLMTIFHETYQPIAQNMTTLPLSYQMELSSFVRNS